MKIDFKNHQLEFVKKLVIVSVLIGFLSSFLAISLKKITEHYEDIFFLKASSNLIYFFVFPFLGLTVIYFLRKYLFKGKENKGIKEIFESMSSDSKHLPMYKVPSHFVNGFLTVILGGSTGIEVSTVVASATIGSVAQQKDSVFKKYKTELICAGIAAGVTALFSSPIAGILFSIEVISRKVNKIFLATCLISVGVASSIIYFLDEPALFSIKIITWHYQAIPYFVLLGILAGINSVFLTKCVLFCKKQFSKISNSYNRIVLGVLIIGTFILLFPNLYGDSYHGVKDILAHPNTKFSFAFFVSTFGILILKPLLSSVTLASGGDGGVFAPSLVIGAFLGFLVATFLNTFFNANVLPINFIVIGMAAMLSASIHAPFTSLFLVCGLINDYTLFFPILVVCLISKFTAKKLLPYTVYSYSLNLVK